MASTSTSTSRMEELAPSTSGSSMPAFVRYNPPATKLAFRRDKMYHVFLSFRGPDVRKTLVDHLFQALSSAGLNVFIDSEKLEKGEMIELSLERAIESSVIRIPIFSKGYADSTWCLKEAAAMLNTPALIIPLFYHVEPTHVRYPESESSPYKQSFLKHYRHSKGEIEWWKHALQQICPCIKFYGHSVRHKVEDVDEWKKALREICGRSGWSTDLTEVHEAWLVKMVVKDLIKTLDRVPLEVAKHPVGMDSVKNSLIQKLNLNSVHEVVKVGIWGIGGIGKTTVAKAVYNQLHADFDAASFVFNVRTTAAEATGLIKLQKKILKNLSEYGKKVDSVDEGKSLFRDRLGGKRVLLILDDVDALEQLNALVGDWLAPGSRVIITSRDQHILNVAQCKCIHEMTELKMNEGLQLFSWHAFLRASPIPRFQDLSTRIVEACKGHPLSLEVIGSSLYDKHNNIDCWTEALSNITLNPGIHERLYISYRGLTDDEKEIFVDIACFFIGEHKRLPIIFWESLYQKVHTAVLNLSMKLLIKIDDEGVFDMHDHLRDMGRSIAEKEKSGTRLWETSLDIGSNDISRLRLNGGNPRLEMLDRPGLRYLHLQNMSIDTKNMLEMSQGLIWLRLENCRTLFRERSRARKKPRDSRYVGNVGQLKIMDLGGCNGLDELPDTIGNLSQLQHLDLTLCVVLNNLPDTIGNLSQLQHLDLTLCVVLNNLPDTIGNLSQLQHLNLTVCVGLNNLPDTIGNLSQLQHLDLRGCRGLNNLPDTIGNLSQLQHLDLGVCMGLNNLPDTIGNLSQLQHFALGECEGLNNLPDTIGNLSQLQHLDLGECRGLNNLPDTIGNLSQLQHLYLRGCRGLNNLPDTIGNLSQLQYLNLTWCERLNKLPDTIGNLSQLQHLNLKWCERLNNLPDTIGNLSQLQHLNLQGCVELKNLPTIDNLSQLQFLKWPDGSILKD